MASRQAVLDALRAGDALAVQHDFFDPEGDRWFLVKAGRRVSKRTVAALKDQLVPVGDGMFGTSQSYRLADEDAA